MLARTIALSIALLCSSAVAHAEETKSGATAAKAAPQRVASVDAGQYREALEANAARVAVRNTLAPAAQPSRAELFGILLLMQMERREANTGVRQ
jgi:hypothetical protein